MCKQKHRLTHRQEVVLVWSQVVQQLRVGDFWSPADGEWDGTVFGPVLFARQTNNSEREKQTTKRRRKLLNWCIFFKVHYPEKHSLKDLLQLLHLCVALKQRPVWKNRHHTPETVLSLKEKAEHHQRYVTSRGKAQRRCSRRSTRPPTTCTQSWAAPQELCTTASPPGHKHTQQRLITVF